ncbi:MAG: zinc ABC transporter substrate-binding protein [Tissierellales bacterium]|jgi:zinc transport system substrate-binding protein|nr:zinc ABC transporter substrate-binding protein [Tissierellales bacterium]
MKFLKKIGIVLMASVLFTACAADKEDKTSVDIDKELEKEVPIIAVSIVPEANFVSEVAGDLVDVVTMIPPGNSPANYQPTPKQMEKFSEAKIYFTIGVGAEAAIEPKAKELNKDMKLIALDDVVEAVYPARYFSEADAHEHETEIHDEHEHDEHETEMHDEHEHDEHETEVHDEHEHDEHQAEVHEEHGDENDHSHDVGAKDPHIWMSPKRVQVMVERIKDELISLDPDHKTAYETNASAYLEELKVLDEAILKKTENLTNRSFIVYHPALGYFADDYDFNMVTIESDGKKATVDQLAYVIDFAKENDIKAILYQNEFDPTQAQTVANEIGGKAIQIDPLAYEYVDQMTMLAKLVEEILK